MSKAFDMTVDMTATLQWQLDFVMSKAEISYSGTCQYLVHIPNLGHSEKSFIEELSIKRWVSLGPVFVSRGPKKGHHGKSFIEEPSIKT